MLNLLNYTIMIKSIILATLFMLPCLSINLPAQSLQEKTVIDGTVITAENTILAEATVQLLDAQDNNTVQKIVLSDQNGKFTFSNVPVGQYMVRISYIGFEPIYKPVTVYSTKQISLGNIGLKLKETILDEIVIYAKTTNAQ